MRFTIDEKGKANVRLLQAAPESTHTPAPWTLHEGYEVEAAGADLHVATVYSHGDEGAANARLIAAAPDMFAALRRMERFLINCESNGGSTEGQNLSLGKAIDMMTRAIQLAERS